MANRNKKTRSRKDTQEHKSKKNAYVYGFHALEQLLKKSPKKIRQVFVLNNRNDRRLESVKESLVSAAIAFELKDKDFLDRVSDAAVHQGVIAEINPAEVQNEQFLEALLINKEQPFLLILDQVQDPHNLGAVLRSAAAFGVDAVIAPKRNACGLTATVRKVAVGCAELIPYVQVTNLARTMRLLKDANVEIYGLAGEGKKELFSIHVPHQNGVALVMGNEAKGMRRLTREHCDHLIYIAMQAGVESLNVSVAAGISLNHFKRLRS